jgi:uncharacterized membrane protein
MSTIIISLFVFLLLTAGVVGILLAVYVKSRSVPHKTGVPTPVKVNPASSSTEKLTLRLTDVLLPVLVLIVAAVLTIVFYLKVPGQVAYHYDANELADRWMGRNQLVIITLLPQLLLAFLSILIASVMFKVAGSFVKEGKARPSTIRGVVGMMSNMIVLPQLILLFATLEIFIYNAYHVHIMPLYIFAILVIIFGTLILGLLFIREIRQSRK